MAQKPRTLREFIGAATARTIDAAPQLTSRRHPTWYPLFAQRPGPLDILTDQAVRLITRENGGESWLKGLVPRLINISDHEGAAAALAELRAFGALLEAGFAVNPIPRKKGVKTPDFEADCGAGAVVVEVFSKHQDKQQKALLEKAHRGETPPGVHRQSMGRLKMTMVETAPAGAPDPAKPNDSVQANLISRVCGIKGAEGQIDPSRPAVLWIDFSNFGIWPEGLGASELEPLRSGHQGLSSGGVWYAFYGWRGAPIFEEDFDFSEHVFAMGHEGRFRMQGKAKSRFSGSIVCVPGDSSVTTSLLENPWAACRLPDKTRRYLERLPWFDLAHSVCDWRKGDAEARVELGRREIEVIKEWHDQLNA